VSLLKPHAPSFTALTPDRWMYYCTLFVLLACLWLVHNLVHSYAGRAVIAIRDHALAAAVMGIDVAKFKTLTCGVSAMITGTAGGLFALCTEFVGPDSFTIFLSIDFLVGCVVGGLATLSGALWGALFIRLVPMFADELSKELTWVIYGVSLIAVMHGMPAGAAGVARALLARLGSALNLPQFRPVAELEESAPAAPPS